MLDTSQVTLPMQSYFSTDKETRHSQSVWSVIDVWSGNATARQRVAIFSKKSKNSTKLDQVWPALDGCTSKHLLLQEELSHCRCCCCNALTSLFA